MTKPFTSHATWAGVGDEAKGYWPNETPLGQVKE